MLRIIGFNNKESFCDGVTTFINIDIDIDDADERKKLYELQKIHIEVRFSKEGLVASEVILYSLDGDESDEDIEWEIVKLFQFTKKEIEMIDDYITDNNLIAKC